MAGGPSTPALAAAVAGGGAYGFMAGGYLSAEGPPAGDRQHPLSTDAPFGVNLFIPRTPGHRADIEAYAAALAPEAERLGVALGAPRWEDDGYAAKLDVVESARVHLVTFTFGCPRAAAVDRLHRVDRSVGVTVTSAPEAGLAARGRSRPPGRPGDRGRWAPGNLRQRGANRRALTAAGEIGEATTLPMIGAGGVMSGADAATVLRAGAIAVQLGTALLCTPEAGTSVPTAQASSGRRRPDTIVTRAYSGRVRPGPGQPVRPRA